jgi:hypothetical protein
MLGEGKNESLMLENRIFCAINYEPTFLQIEVAHINQCVID